MTQLRPDLLANSFMLFSIYIFNVSTLAKELIMTNATQKKVYQAPKLSLFGKVADLTASSNNNGQGG